MLQAHGLWQDDHAKASDHIVDFAAKDAADLRSTLSYLVEVHGGAALKAMFSPLLLKTDWGKLNRGNAVAEVIEALKIRANDTRAALLVRASEEGISVAGFRRLCEINLYSTQQSPIRCDDLSFNIANGALTIATSQGDGVEPIPLDDFLKNLPSSSNDQLPVENMTFDYQSGQRALRLIFRSVQFNREPEKPRILSCHFFVLEK